MSLFRPALIVGIWFGVVVSVTGQDKAEPAAPQKQAARVDFQGDPLPDDVLVRLGSARLRHGFYAKDVAFSPDGTRVASAGYDHAVRLWDVATGKELRRFTSESVEAITNRSARWFHCLAFSPDGKRLACGEYFESAPSNLIRIWDVATGKVLDALDRGKGGVPSIAYSPDGATLASGGRDGMVHLWDKTGQQKQVLAGHKGTVRSVAWSRKGDMLVTGSDDTSIRLWDSATGRELRQLQGHQLAVESVNFSPDGRRIVSGSKDLTIRLWDTSTGKEQADLGRHDRVVYRVAFSPDGKTVASASGDKAIKLWDVGSGKMAGVLEGHCKDVCGLAFSPDGKTLASISDDHKLGLWDLATRKELHPQPGHQDSNMGLVFLDKGAKLLTIGKDDTIRWWDWRTGKEERSISWPILRTARATCISPAGDLVAVASRDGGLLVLETKSGKELGRPGDGRRPVVAADLSHDSRFLAFTLGKGIALWDVVKRKPAVWGLASRPADSVRYIKTKLKPAPTIDGARLAAIIANLDSDVFTTREQATKELHDLGDVVEPTLRNLVDKGPSLEVKRCAKSVLDQLTGPLISPQRMQSLRAIEALEHMGSAEARALLLELARGAVAARSTREAAAALERMKKH